MSLPAKAYSQAKLLLSNQSWENRKCPHYLTYLWLISHWKSKTGEKFISLMNKVNHFQVFLRGQSFRHLVPLLYDYWPSDDIQLLTLEFSLIASKASFSNHPSALLFWWWASCRAFSKEDGEHGHASRDFQEETHEGIMSEIFTVANNSFSELKLKILD